MGHAKVCEIPGIWCLGFRFRAIICSLGESYIHIMKTSCLSGVCFQIWSSGPCEDGWVLFDNRCYLYMNNSGSRYQDIDVCRWEKRFYQWSSQEWLLVARRISGKHPQPGGERFCVQPDTASQWWWPVLWDYVFGRKPWQWRQLRVGWWNPLGLSKLELRYNFDNLNVFHQ